MKTAQATDPNTAELHDSALGSITAQCWRPEQPDECPEGNGPPAGCAEEELFIDQSDPD